MSLIKLLERAKKLKEKSAPKESALLQKTKESAASASPDLLNHLLEIKTMLLNLLLAQQEAKLSSLVSKSESSKEAQSVPLKEALDNLEEFTTNKKDKDGKRTFLLHRPTPDFEYQKYANENSYETTQPTEWIAEIEAAEYNQKQKNPVVSAWVQEDKIQSISGAIDNTGAWGEMQTNPNATKYTITIKPGKYEIYRELRN